MVLQESRLGSLGKCIVESSYSLFCVYGISDPINCQDLFRICLTEKPVFCLVYLQIPLYRYVYALQLNCTSLPTYLFLLHEHMVVLLPVSESKELQDNLGF